MNKEIQQGMGTAKTECFTEEQNELASIAKALGHPARIAILQYLLKVDTCICGEIVSELPLAQATISRHLKELKAVGILRGSVEGTRVNYCIDAHRWKNIRFIFNALLDENVTDNRGCQSSVGDC